MIDASAQEASVSNRVFDHATEAFAFIEDLDRLSTPQGVIDAMERTLALFGFENFIMTGLPHPDQRIESLILLKKWPIDWYQLYTEKHYDRHDPVIHLCRRSVQPLSGLKRLMIPRSTLRRRRLCMEPPNSEWSKAIAFRYTA